jgi:hypothetical protein
LGAA